MIKESHRLAMKRPLLLTALLGILAFPLANAQTTPSPVITIPGTTVTRTATIQLGLQPSIMFITALPPSPPLTFVAGTRLQMVAPWTTLSDPTGVRWFKDGKQLTATGLTLEIASASAADSGSYYAMATASSGTAASTTYSDTAQVFVTGQGQRLSSFSTRAHIDATQPFFLSGFVVEPGPAKAFVLVRCVGAALKAFGVNDALDAPQMRIFDAEGSAFSQSYAGTMFPLSVTEAAQRVGAFPLPEGSKDCAQVYSLSPGAYTVQLSSADGGTGTTLLEINEVPM